MKQNTDSSSFSLLPDAGGYDPIEDRLRANVRATIEAMFEGNPPISTACLSVG